MADGIAAGVMRRTKWPITSGKDALKIKGIGQGMADRVSLLSILTGISRADLDRLMNGSTGVRGDNFTRPMIKSRLSRSSKTSTVSVCQASYQKPNQVCRSNVSGRARANEFYQQGARTIDDLKSGRYDLTEGQRVAICPSALEAIHSANEAPRSVWHCTMT